MTHKLTHLLSLKAAAGDERLPVRALFHDAETRRLARVALDAGGWFDRREVLVAIDRFGPPSEETWPLSMTSEEIADAPEWQGDRDAGLSLPPLVIGPLGYTFSPMMMAAGMSVSADRQMPKGPEGASDLVADSGGTLEGLERSGDWIGKEAFAEDGFLGRVADVILNTDLTLSAVVLEDGTELALTRLRNAPEQGHLVFA